MGSLPEVLQQTLVQLEPDIGRPTRDEHRPQISATNDFEAVSEWLREFEHSPKTFNAYHRESGRFLTWCHANGVSLKKLMRANIHAYEGVMRNPPPELVSKKKLPRQHPEWKPFTGTMSESSIKYALTILTAMMAWLKEAGYAKSNPFVLDRRRSKKAKKKEITRYVSKAAINFMLEAAEGMPVKTRAQQRERARARFLVCLYYDGALRLFEPAHSNLDDVTRDEHGHWLRVMGKGEKEAQVPLSERTIDAFNAYLAVFGPPEDGSLLMNARGENTRATDGAIGIALRRIMKAAATIAEEAGQTADAVALKKATPHWLRHARVSHLINDGASVAHVKDLARHANLAITSVYSHSEREQLQRLVGGGKKTR